MKGSIFINKINESLKEQNFIILDDFHAYGEIDECVYQRISKSDVSESCVLVFESKNGDCFNYAEDGDVTDWIKKNDIKGGVFVKYDSMLEDYSLHSKMTYLEYVDFVSSDEFESLQDAEFRFETITIEWE
mgnify:CR=1 FL=1